MVPAAQGSVVIAWWLGQGGAFASVEEKDGKEKYWHKPRERAVNVRVDLYLMLVYSCHF